MRILVTGADGFVGRHLVRELSDHGHSVIASDRRTSGDDLALPWVAENLVRQTNPDYVVHLAARYGRLLCRDEPHRSVSDNTASTTELASVCAEKEIPILYSSSSEVYGDHGRDTITEESELRTPTTIYGLSKRWGEEALQLYMPLGRLTIVRMNMLYGPEQLGGYGRCSLATFIKNATEGKPFTVHTSATRSWLYISDAVRALRLLIEERHAGIYNLGNPQLPTPMRYVADAVVKECAGATLPRYLLETPPANQIRHKNYDCSKLLSTIDWKPRVDIREGIRRTAEWAREEVQVAA